MYDKLQQLGGPHIQKFDEADREQVFNCIRDRTGRFLTQDEFFLYVETEDKIEKLKYMFTGDAREALKDYYDVVHTLCEAQTNFVRSTQVLEEKIEDKSIFLSNYKTGTTANGTSTSQNGGRNGEARKQDLQRADTVTTFAEF